MLFFILCHWNKGIFGGSGYQDEWHLLRVNVSRLRGKLGEDSEHQHYIVTEPEVGYFMPLFNPDSNHS